MESYKFYSIIRFVRGWGRGARGEELREISRAGRERREPGGEMVDRKRGEWFDSGRRGATVRLFVFTGVP